MGVKNLQARKSKQWPLAPRSRNGGGKLIYTEWLYQATGSWRRMRAGLPCTGHDNIEGGSTFLNGPKPPTNYDERLGEGRVGAQPSTMLPQRMSHQRSILPEFLLIMLVELARVLAFCPPRHGAGAAWRPGWVASSRDIRAVSWLRVWPRWVAHCPALFAAGILYFVHNAVERPVCPSWYRGPEEHGKRRRIRGIAGRV
jgi:hypothetical protein